MCHCKLIASDNNIADNIFFCIWQLAKYCEVLFRKLTQSCINFNWCKIIECKTY